MGKIHSVYCRESSSHFPKWPIDNCHPLGMQKISGFWYIRCVPKGVKTIRPNPARPCSQDVVQRQFHAPALKMLCARSGLREKRSTSRTVAVSMCPFGICKDWLKRAFLLLSEALGIPIDDALLWRSPSMGSTKKSSFILLER